MDDIQRAIEILKRNKPTSDPRLCGKELCNACDVAISAMQELQQIQERIEQLKKAEVWSFKCKLPDGRICHFSDIIEFLEKGQVE